MDYSDASNEASATPTAPPAAVANLMADAGDGSVALSWTTAGDGGSAITKHQYREKEGSGSYGSWSDIPNSAAGETNANSYTVANLTINVVYTFEVRAVNAGGPGPAVRVSATPMGLLAVDDTVETSEDTPVTIAVLENDRGTGPLTVMEVSAPAHGTAVLAAAGEVVYTPELDYHGSDRFTYVVGGGSGTDGPAGSGGRDGAAGERRADGRGSHPRPDAQERSRTRRD